MSTENQTRKELLAALDSALSRGDSDIDKGYSLNIGVCNNEIAALEDVKGIPRTHRRMRIKECHARLRQLERLPNRTPTTPSPSDATAKRNAMPVPVAPVLVASVISTPKPPALPRAALCQIATQCFSFEIQRPQEMQNDELAKAVQACAIKEGVQLPGMPAVTPTGSAQSRMHASVKGDMARAIIKANTKQTK